MTTNSRWASFLFLFFLGMFNAFMYTVGAFGQGAGFMGIICVIAGAAILLAGDDE